MLWKVRFDDAGRPTREELTKSTLASALRWARERDYAGWDPYDGLNSPVLSAIGRNWLSRLVGIHLVNRAPINLRPLLGVPRERNPMGIALFARTLLYRYERQGSERHLAEAESLLAWLLSHRSPSYGRSCWGYNFDWQNGRKFFLRAYEPCMVVSVICGEAFLHHWRVTGDERSLRVGREVGEFITAEMTVLAVDGHEVYSYTPDDDFVVVNANALAASYLAQLHAAGATGPFGRRADELAAFVVDAQTDYGAWYYSIPPEDSHLTHDNFHTGYILESLREYARLTEDGAAARAAYERGLEFYRRRLFDPDGAPKFDHESRFPHDIHSAAQGIRTFVRDGRDDALTEARTIVDWSLEHMFDAEGYFYRRRGRLFDDTTPYIRWSQAWMCFALASFLYYADDERTRPKVAP